MSRPQSKIIKTKVIPRWWKNRSNRGSDVLDYAGFGTMQLRFAILTNCYTPFSSSQSGEANGESAARYTKPNTNCLKKNVSIGLQCKIRTKVNPRWGMKSKIERAVARYIKLKQKNKKGKI